MHKAFIICDFISSFHLHFWLWTMEPKLVFFFLFTFTIKLTNELRQTTKQFDAEYCTLFYYLWISGISVPACWRTCALDKVGRYVWSVLIKRKPISACWYTFCYDVIIHDIICAYMIK